MVPHGNVLTHLRGLIIFLPWLVWLGIVDLLLSLLLPVKFIAPNLVYNLSSCLAVTVWWSIQAIFESLNGARITISGDELPRGESAVVVCNHVGWADFYMIQALATKAGMLSRQRYFAKAQLRYVPFLGWGLWVIGFPLLSRNWQKDKSELEKVFSDLASRKWPVWLVSFSEASRFTPRKYEESKSFCLANGKTQPKNLLYPRTKGFVAMVKQLRERVPHVKAVYVLTIAYRRRTGHGDSCGNTTSGDGLQKANISNMQPPAQPRESAATFQEAPSMWETFSVPGLSDGPEGYEFYVKARRYAIEKLPKGDGEQEDNELLAEWLERRWLESGEWLEGLKKGRMELGS